MRLTELESQNAKTLAAIKDGQAQRARAMEFPFHGYYEADIFECPPFLMYTNNDCPRAWDILFHRNFEQMSMRIWCRLARFATAILDIGAHVGVYSLAASTLRNDIPIHSFEPNPYAFARLRMHKLLNNFHQIREHAFAVGDHNKRVKFRWRTKASAQIPSGGGVHVVGPIEAGWQHITVSMQTLDATGLAQLLDDKSLIKIDVEGAEALAFLGMTEALARKPNIILETFSEVSCNVINPMIRSLGYSVYLIDETKLRVIPRPQLLPCAPSGENFNQLLTTMSEAEVINRFN